MDGLNILTSDCNETAHRASLLGAQDEHHDAHLIGNTLEETTADLI